MGKKNPTVAVSRVERATGVDGMASYCCFFKSLTDDTNYFALKKKQTVLDEV